MINGEAIRTFVIRAFAIGLFAAGIAVPVRADANPLGMYGFGSRSTAMAGAVSADVEDFSANYYNPAGLVRGRALRVDLGYFWAAHQLQTNGADNHVDPAHGLVGGIVAPGSIFGLRFAFGLALHVPDDRISRSRSLQQTQPRWELYDNRVQLIYIAANLAISPVPWLRIGGGLGFVSSTRGNLDIYGDIAIPTSSDSRLMHTVDADLTSVRYPQAGIQVDPMRNLTLSAVYRGQYQIALDIEARVQGDIVVGRPSDPAATRIPGTYFLHSRSVAVFQPQHAILGASLRPTDNLTIDLDVTWVNWSAYVNPSAQLQVSLDLSIPPGLNFNPPGIPPAQAVEPARFRDTLVPRLGLEWRHALGVHTTALRAGYRYDPSPVPEQTGRTNFLDSNRHVISVGAGLFARGMAPVLPGGVSIDVHGDVQVLEHRVTRKESPVDPVGDYTVGGTVWTAGLTLGLAF